MEVAPSSTMHATVAHCRSLARLRGKARGWFTRFGSFGARSRRSEHLLHFPPGTFFFPKVARV